MFDDYRSVGRRGCRKEERKEGRKDFDRQKPRRLIDRLVPPARVGLHDVLRWQIKYKTVRASL